MGRDSFRSRSVRDSKNSLLIPEEICSGFGLLADNFLLFEHRQKSQEFTEIPYGQFRLNSILRFLAKNSDARSTKSLRYLGVGRPCFLPEIPKALREIFSR